MNLLSQLKEKVKTAKTHEDNQPAIVWSEKGGKSTKHLDINFHYVQGQLLHGAIVISYCLTDKMQADLQRKPVSAEKTTKFIKDLKMITR